MTFHSPVEPDAQPPEAPASAGVHPNLPTLIDALPGDETRAAQTGFDRARQVAFLHALADCGMARRAARSVGVSHQSAYRMRRAEPAFRLAWDAALLAARCLAEDVLATRALDGIEETVFYRGEAIATRRRYDSRLLLAHLGRLDKLTEDARTSAFADDFEAGLERFERGEDQPDPGRVPADAGTSGFGAQPHEAPASAVAREEAGVSSLGQCNNRSMSRADDEPEPCPDCGGRCLDPDPEVARSDCPAYEERIERMYSAYPRSAPWPEELPPAEAEAVEAAQLAAFEAGLERWWEVVGLARAGAGAGDG